MTDPIKKKTKSEKDGRVIRDPKTGKPIRKKGYGAKMKNNANTVKSYSTGRVTGDPGNYVARKMVRSEKKGNVTRDVNSRPVMTTKGRMQKKYGN